MDQKMQKIRDITRKLRPIDDVLFQKMAEDIEFCEEVITTIMGEKVEVVETIPQESIKNLQGRSVILDALCKGADDRYFNMEIQRSDSDDHQRRVRYNASCVTANMTPTSAKFKDVAEVCVIYISEFDLFGQNKSVYHVDRILRENGEFVQNGLIEIYVNATSTESGDVSELMKIFTERDAYNDKKFPATSRRKRQFTEPEEGENTMCEEWNNLLAEEKAEGKARNIMTTVERYMARHSCSASDACDVIGYDFEEYADAKAFLEKAEECV